MSKDILYPLRRLHGMMVEYKPNREYLQSFLTPFREKRKANPNTVFLLLTPQHGNMGDHAIAQAETDLLEANGIDYVEITGEQLNELRCKNLLRYLNGYPILMQGGGYLGTLWFESELCLREVIRKLSKSQIIFLPNTIFYEPNDWGNEEFQNSIRCYNRHRKLKLFAREKTSFEVMHKVYRDVKLVPDIVLSMNLPQADIPRSGCLLCLRNDCEKTRDDAYDRCLREQAASIFGDRVVDTDMVVKGTILPSQRKVALQTKFDEFRGAELVITDRLHGMIFCAITGTPCIVINSKSPKVRGCYEWIKQLDYIRFADDVASIAQEYQRIPQGPHDYDNEHLQHYFDDLLKDILSIASK